ncbi:MAG: phosphoglucomutase (alpha-D-glucose-1,6-bisphosphate-dependent) [Polyangiaceae bacterium]|nr:phosphoglucomutase (alpha-D-glucose-1,6-bisphosphate-dependent) [Polyangiaceae bacterium]
MSLSPLAGKKAPPSLLENIPRLISAYYSIQPDLDDPRQKVAFGTSGHRGSAFDGRFNEAHILATTQAICEIRHEQGITGPLFLGMDTHALSEPAFISALEVLAANGIETCIDDRRGYTPTPVVSHAIISHNRSHPQRLADGILITPSHNPPRDGGFKYNPAHGGPAGPELTGPIQDRANHYLANGLKGVQRVAYQKALESATTHLFDYTTPYVSGLEEILDMEAIAGSGLHLGADPLGGAGVHYWEPIVEKYKINLDIISKEVDPTFGFMHVDKDGKIRIDCSSPYAMSGLISLKGQYDLAFGNDTDFDRHGIVTQSRGLLNPNHYLAVAIQYLFTHREGWGDAGIGKTLVSSSMINRVAASLKRQLIEVPVGFKWFVDGLRDGTLGFGGEESAGASFLKKDRSTWTTDKDGIILDLLGAEMMAKTEKDPGELYAELEQKFGSPVYERLDAPASPEEKLKLKNLRPEDVQAEELAGEPILARLTEAPGNKALIGGLKVETENAWFAARPSGTEDVYKIYGESFRGKAHLKQVQEEAKAIVAQALKA